MLGQGIYIGIDIGGSWLKAISVKVTPDTKMEDIPSLVETTSVCRVRSRLGADAQTNDFIAALGEILSLVSGEDSKILGIGISTAGVVDYKGESVTITANHLKALKDARWLDYLRQHSDAPVVLINDADAASIGAAWKGYLKGQHTIGIMPIGTGTGFTIWRNGRRWHPNQILPLLGCIDTPAGSYDEVAGVSSMAASVGHDLNLIFSEPEYKATRDNYEENLAKVIYTACVLYHTDIILIGGGLAEAIKANGYPIADSLQRKLDKSLSALEKKVEVKVMAEGNTLPLIGAVILAAGESIASPAKAGKSYKEINTEIPYDSTLALHSLNAEEIIQTLYNAEEKAGKDFQASLPDISEAVKEIAVRLADGGRLIYVGAGTSGRLAAIDTVELACTFGFPRERVYTLIAGGLADAAIDIESNFEEDASCVPELLLTTLNKKDVVIGISVSGSAYYVLSALALSKEIGAYTVFIQESSANALPFCDKAISLHSGHEVIAGSTRMKAGTATKKALNFISTTAMILLGKVYGPYMVEMECINQKLICRAQNILNHLFDLNEEDSYKLLEDNGFNLKKTIMKISESEGLYK